MNSVTSQPPSPVHSPPVLELALGIGHMRGVDWLSTVRAAADSGIHHLVLTGPDPARHPAAQALGECGTACGMQVHLSAAPPISPASQVPRVRISADGIPRLVIPEGIPTSDLLTRTDLAWFAPPPILRALEAATFRHEGAA
ncbi:hypothetical protein [Streptomyces sp. NBC_01190]|uniref:hypothetical protein n=1 Tax=Streptomyces sp. NBC_01190 TaxID=2903767 RepID=UPI00386D8C0B|nr:hypothetical protein OG519_28335 [Streptomyces sp. NBC_01190]